MNHKELMYAIEQHIQGKQQPKKNRSKMRSTNRFKKSTKLWKTALEDKDTWDDAIDDVIQEATGDNSIPEDGEDYIDSHEFEDTGIDIKTDIVDEIKEAMHDDEESVVIEKNEAIMLQSQQQVDKLERLRDNVIPLWEKHGDISDEVVAVDPAIESAWRTHFKSTRTPQALYGAVEHTYVQLSMATEVAMVTYNASKIALRLKRFISGFKNPAHELSDTVSHSFHARLNMRNSFNEENIGIETIANLDEGAMFADFIRKNPSGMVSPREVSNYYIESSTQGLTNRVVAGLVNSNTVVEAVAAALGEAQNDIEHNVKDLDIFFKAFDVAMDRTAADNEEAWESITSVPFINAQVGKINAVVAQMKQLPTRAPTLKNIEDTEKVASTLAGSLNNRLDINKSSYNKVLDTIEKRSERIGKMANDPDKAVQRRGRALAKALDDYVEAIEQVIDFTNEFANAALILKSVIQNHTDMIIQLDSLNR